MNPPLLSVSVRWRSPTKDKKSPGSNTFGVSQEDDDLEPTSTTTSREALSIKFPAFRHVFSETTDTQHVYHSVVAPSLSNVLRGGTSNFFAYGHSGSGKTHTIIGYDFDLHSMHLGLVLSAARDVFNSFQSIEGTHDLSKKDSGTDSLGVALRMYEIRGKNANDLLNNRKECHIREDSDGNVHIRGETEILDGGKVRVQPVVAIPCWSYVELQDALLAGLSQRITGSSTIHDESSRPHAILELEIVTQELADVRQAVIERESELVPVGKRATDVYIEEHMKSLVKTAEGKYIPNADHPLNQKRIDTAEAEKQKYEACVKEAEDAVTAYVDSSPHSCLGGKFVFVDLAGAEYFHQDKTLTPLSAGKQDLQQQRQGRQINADLFALKEVFRSKAAGKGRVPYRSAPLTMVLRSYFELKDGKSESSMILTVSPDEDQASATRNTLKYGDLINKAAR